MSLVALIVSVALNVVSPADSSSQVPEWQPKIIIRAAYGDKENEYGYSGVTKWREDGESPAWLFYVGDKNIYVEDYYQGSIKEYDLSGHFLRAVLLERGPARKIPRLPAKTKAGGPLPPIDSLPGVYVSPAPHNISDFVVSDSVIYAIFEGGGVPPPEQANVYARAYDLSTGKKLQDIRIYNPGVARHGGGFTYNAAKLSVGPRGSIWIFDGVNDVSIPIARTGKAVPAAEHMNGVRGQVLGSRRLVWNTEKQEEDLVDSTGAVIRSTFARNSPVTWGSLTALRACSGNGGYFLKCSGRTNKEWRQTCAMTTWDGREVARLTWPTEDRRWWTYPIEDLIQVGPDGSFYWVYPDSSEVDVYRWGK
jgi:hypothetical protein